MIEEPFACQKCGEPQTKNPHPDAGKPNHILEVGYEWECIPCLVKNRHAWAERAMKAEKRVRELEEEMISAETERDQYRNLLAMFMDVEKNYRVMISVDMGGKHGLAYRIPQGDKGAEWRTMLLLVHEALGGKSPETV